MAAVTRRSLGAMTEKTPEHNKREAPISYRPPQALRDEFHVRVKRSGLSTSGFITTQIFNGAAPRQSRRPAPEAQELVRILTILAAVTDDIKDGTADSPETFDKLAVARNTVMDILGRLP